MRGQSYLVGAKEPQVTPHAVWLPSRGIRWDRAPTHLTIPDAAVSASTPLILSSIFRSDSGSLPGGRRPTSALHARLCWFLRGATPTHARSAAFHATQGRRGERENRNAAPPGNGRTRSRGLPIEGQEVLLGPDEGHPLFPYPRRLAALPRRLAATCGDRISSSAERACNSAGYPSSASRNVDG